MIGELAGHMATHAMVWIPKWGLPWAEVSIDGEVDLTGSVTLTIADTSWKMTVVSGGPDVGRSHFRLVGGAGGWGRDVPPKGYANDLGVKVSTVLTDAATAAGESFGTTLPTTKTGPAFAREGGPGIPAGRVLQQLFPEAWYVANDGLTYLGERAASTLETEYTAGPVNLATGTVELAADDIAGIVPGLVVEGLTVADVLHELTPRTLRSYLYGAASSPESRRLAAYKAIHEQLFPNDRYRGLFEFRVVTQEGERLNLQPVLTSIRLPDLRRVPVCPGVPGVKATHLLGSRVLVAFVNADPSRPRVVGFEDAEGPGFVPTLLNLCNGTKGVARDDDPVQAGYLISGPGPVINYRATAIAPWVPLPAGTGPGGAPDNVLDAGVQLTGDITGASTKVRAA